jgi:hypothetical protein
MDNKILLDKNGVKCIKSTDETFNIAFTVENSLDVRPLINLNLIKLLHDLNPDLFESYSEVNSDENERHLYILFKDLFADLGIPQYYYNFSLAFASSSTHVTVNHDSSTTIKFIMTPIDYLENMNNGSTTLMCVPLTHCEIVCTLINNTIGQFNITAHTTNAELFNSFFEKMVAMILYKVVNRLKQFISTIT